MTDVAAVEAFPPGEYLRDELEARGWTQTEFAEILGRPVRLVNEILAGKRGITPDTAREIGAALGTSPMLWLNLEAAYRLYSSPDPVPSRIARQARIRERFAVREMVKRQWIESSKNPEILEAQIQRFFGIADLDEVPRLPHAAKKTGYPNDLNPAQLAWLFRVKQLADAIPTQPYSAKALRAAIPELRALLLSPEGVREVPQILASCGVRFVVIEHVTSSKIDGVCLWLDNKSPVIGMSLRLDRIDNFWFVLRHEIEHVLNKHGRDEAIIDSESEAGGLRNQGNAGEEEELIANQAAADFCVPSDEMDDFILRHDPLFREGNVVDFARRIRVHPGLVVGQLQKKTGRWNLFRSHLVKVRHLITSVALVDGYGQTIPLVS
jgi:HTH-type transcriptional regulator/antitoxin HigA